MVKYVYIIVNHLITLKNSKQIDKREQLSFFCYLNIGSWLLNELICYSGPIFHFLIIFMINFNESNFLFVRKIGIN